MLIASHRLEEVASLVNRVIEMEQGRIVLDDAVADRLVAGEQRQCSIVLNQRHDSFERAVKALGFAAGVGGLRYDGKIPAAESFRFLGLLSRYASLIDSFEFTAAPPSAKELH